MLQNVMAHLFRDIEGVEVIVDDLVVWADRMSSSMMLDLGR